MHRDGPKSRDSQQQQRGGRDVRGRGGGGRGRGSAGFEGHLTEAIEIAQIERENSRGRGLNLKGGVERGGW